MTEEYPLPPGWAWTTLGEICSKPQYGWTTKASKAKGTVRLLRTTDISSGSIDWNTVPYCTDIPEDVEAYQLKEGDIVISRAGSVGISYLLSSIPENTIFASYLIRFQAYASIDRKYIAYYLQSPMYWKTIHEQSSGIALANVNARKLEALELPLPPLAEQQRIVEAIEERFSHIDAGVALLKAARRKLRLYRASVLKAAVEGALTEQWRGLHPDIEPAPQLLRRILAERRARWEEEQRARGRDPRNLRYAEPAAPDTSRLPPLPDGWCWATIESISTKVVDGVHKKPDYVGKGIPFVTVRNLTAGPGISFEKLNYITEKDHIEFCKRANPERGDILITKDGTLGVVRAIRTDIQFSIFVSVSLIKPVMRIMSDYLEVALSSPQVQMQMIPKGSGLQHLHLEDLRMDCIPLPPLAEQEQIVALVEEQLSIIGNVEATIEHGLRRAERQRQSVLRQAFTGQLVPQDENDEPASVLLERIRGAMNRATTPGGSGERGQRGEGRERGQKKPGQPPRPAPARPPASIAPPGVDASNTVQPELWEGIEA